MLSFLNSNASQLPAPYVSGYTGTLSEPWIWKVAMF